MRGPLVVAGAIGLLAVVSLRIDTIPYGAIFGSVDPALVVAGLIALGAAALVLLDRSGLFAFDRPARRGRGFAAAASLAVMFAALVVVVDVVVGFPMTYNVPPPFPASLLFYTVISYVAEMAFHALPLVAVVLLTTSCGRSEPRESTLRLAMLGVACLEPLYQARLGVPGTEAGIAWVEIFVVMHVFAINLVQLGLFRQFGFLPAYLFRLVYYFLWHVAWGELRQILLF